MQIKCALNKQLTFIIPTQSVVRLFSIVCIGVSTPSKTPLPFLAKPPGAHYGICVTVIKSTSNQKILQPRQGYAETYSESCQTCKMELFAKIVNSLE